NRGVPGNAGPVRPQVGCTGRQRMMRLAWEAAEGRSVADGEIDSAEDLIVSQHDADGPVAAPLGRDPLGAPRPPPRPAHGQRHTRDLFALAQPDVMDLRLVEVARDLREEIHSADIRGEGRRLTDRLAIL